MVLLTSNSLVKQVDLPVWEWTRPTPVGATAGLSSTCVADSPLFNEVSGRFVYLLANATGFYRYDTYADSYMQLASPGITALTASSMQFTGAQGYYGRVISGTANTIQTGLPFGEQAEGYRIRIISGKGMGQERIITHVSDPTIADSGAATAGASTSLTDTNKRWGFNGTVDNANGWVGYIVRVIGGTGINQIRKILYNSNNTLTIADQLIYAYDNWSAPISPTAGTIGWTAPAAGSMYQIESSTITIDTDWSTIPDNTSKYVIQSGGVWLASGAAAGTGVTFQYYSVLEDIWYAKATNSTFVTAAPTDISLERITENSSIWYTGKATTGTTTTLQDTTANWTVNQWAGYKTFIYSGTGKAQIGFVASNTADTLTFNPALDVGLDSTSRYNIQGYDAGTITTSTGRIIFDSTKNWTTNQWANFAVRILKGTGDGQLRQILSNGKDSLVLYEPWNIQPDSSSAYAIQGNSTDMFLTIGGNSETFIYRTDNCDLITHGRPLDEGIVCVACAFLTDGTSTATHEIYDNKHVPITSISGTTTITATTPQPHQFKPGQWVSIRGVTSGANDQFNVTGKVQILTCPTVNTFTYTPFGTGSGTYQYSSNVTVSTSVIPDAGKYHADSATGGSTTTVTFTRAQPSNINGWYVYGTNIADGAQVLSGAGTTTITLNLEGAGTPTGVIIFTKWPRPVTATYSSGGGGGIHNLTLTGNLPAYCRGWLAQGTNIGVGAIVVGGEGSSTINLGLPSTGTPSGTITFSSPVNNLLPTTATYSTGTGQSITLTAESASYIRGWWVSGTNIPSGAVVTGGESSSTITISNPLGVASPSGTITFYPPSTAPAMFYGTTNAPGLAATGFIATGTAMQLVAQNVNNGTVMTPIAALGLITTPAQARYVVARRDLFGQFYEGQNINYLSGVAVGTQAVTSLVDNNAFWGHATGSGGSAGTTTFTISAIGSPYHNGWFVSGTNISTGTKVLSGGGTTSITVDTPLIGAVSGGVTFAAWNQSLIGRRLRVLSSTGVNQDLTITAANTGSVTFATATAPASGSSSYAILPTIVPGAGTALRWISDSSNVSNKGRYLLRVRGGAVAGVDRFDMTTGKVIPIYYVPFAETLGAGSQYAYDGYDRLYFTKDVTNRFYYLDLNTNIVYGAGQVPYLVGTAGIGNLMEVFKTRDGLKYLFVIRKANVEAFRQLLFY